MSDAMNDWWRGGSIYQIYPRSFCDSGKRGWGDLNGIRKQLPYIASLGVDAIWISPFFKSPMKDFGYDVEDHRHVDPMFGTDDDFDHLIAEAKELGLKVMVDLVLSHTSDQHPWFKAAAADKDSEFSDCFVWAEPNEDGSPPNNWLSIFGGSAWSWNATRRQYYLHNFLASQPDLNYHHPRVWEEVLSIARYWLERGVTGFRLDTVNFYYHDQDLRSNPPTDDRSTSLAEESNPYSYQDHVYDKNRPEVVDFLAALGALMREFPGSVTLGEIGAAQRRCWRLIDEYTKGERLNLCYTFDLLSPNFSADHFRSVIIRSMEQAPETWPCWAFSNHDVARSASRVAPENVSPETVAKLSTSILVSLRGTPCIYQGEELGLPEAHVPFEQLQDPFGIEFWPDFPGRDGCRTPMPWVSTEALCGFTKAETPWLPVSDEHRVRAVNLQEEEDQSTLNLARRVLGMRRAEACLKWGAFRLLEGTPQLLAYERYDDSTSIECYFNLSSETVQVTSSDDTSLIFDGTMSDWREAHGAVNLPPWSWCWLKRAG
ncbi:MAG: alpha-glucosidase [Bradymonadia bacterium]